MMTHLKARHHLPKHAVRAVQEQRGGHHDREVAVVGVGALVGKGQQALRGQARQARSARGQSRQAGRQVRPGSTRARRPGRGGRGSRTAGWGPGPREAAAGTPLPGTLQPIGRAAGRYLVRVLEHERPGVVPEGPVVDAAPGGARLVQEAVRDAVPEGALQYNVPQAQSGQRECRAGAVLLGGGESISLCACKCARHAGCGRCFSYHTHPCVARRPGITCQGR